MIKLLPSGVLIVVNSLIPSVVGDVLLILSVLSRVVLSVPLSVDRSPTSGYSWNKNKNEISVNNIKNKYAK